MAFTVDELDNVTDFFRLAPEVEYVPPVYNPLEELPPEYDPPV